MINILLVSIALVLYSKSSEKINNTKIIQVIGLYVGSQIILVVDLFSEKDILFLLCTILYIILIQKILFKYESKVSFGMYTITYLFTIMVTPIVYKDVVSYQIGLNSPLFTNQTTLLLVLILGYINVLENNKFRNIFAVSILIICILNGLVYNSFYSAVIYNSDIVSIETCEQLAEVTNNHYYELKNDIDCTDTEILTKGRILPYKININGNGYTISNLKLTTDNTRINGQSKITNIGFNNLNIDGNGLVAINYGTIKQVAITNSSIKGNENVGGLVGINYGSITDSYGSANAIKGKFNIGGIAGTNIGEIRNVYSTSFVDGYEYVGGLIGKQSKPGYIQNSFYDDRFLTEATISKGALVIIGQDRETMEVIEGFNDLKVNHEDLKNYYEALNEKEQTIVNKAYKSDNQDWYLGGELSKGSIDNFIVLSSKDYSVYYNQADENISVIENEDIDMAISAITKAIVNESMDSTITTSNINFLSQSMVYEQTIESGDRYIYSLESVHNFSSQIWDFEIIDSNSVEPLKLV